MSTITEPLAAPSVAGVVIRFFAAPTSRTEVPWHSVEDLREALTPPRMRVGHFSPFHDVPLLKGETATVLTECGPVLIESHLAAMGLIGAVADLSLLPSTFEAEYAAAGDAVLDVLNAGLTDEERIDALASMAENTLGVKLMLQPAVTALVMLAALAAWPIVLAHCAGLC